MRIQWYGHSSFALSGDDCSMFIDPFDDMSEAAADGMRWEYPAIEGVEVDLLLVTHEHIDHNGIEAVSGSPTILRSTAGTLESPIGEIVAIASEHDTVAGTEAGPNTIFVFSLDGSRIAHFGDFGQASLRDEQADAIGEVDLVILPVGGVYTIGAAEAKRIVDRLRPRWVVPMHYRTPRIDFLETADAFLGQFVDVRRLDETSFDPTEFEGGEAPTVIVPAVP
jgi:L-ascorbate metabolism protein UlaG (beta-lactamase superfamily)